MYTCEFVEFVKLSVPHCVKLISSSFLMVSIRTCSSVVVVGNVVAKDVDDGILNEDGGVRGASGFKISIDFERFE